MHRGLLAIWVIISSASVVEVGKVVTGGKKRKEKNIFPRCDSVWSCAWLTHTYTQCVGLHTSLPLWHHHQWQRAKDNREELNWEEKLSLFCHSDTALLTEDGFNLQILLSFSIIVDPLFKNVDVFDTGPLARLAAASESSAPLKSSHFLKLLDWITMICFSLQLSHPEQKLKRDNSCTHDNIYSYGFLRLVVGWQYSRVLLLL